MLETTHYALYYGKKYSTWDHILVLPNTQGSLSYKINKNKFKQMFQNLTPGVK